MSINVLEISPLRLLLDFPLGKRERGGDLDRRWMLYILIFKWKCWQRMVFASMTRIQSFGLRVSNVLLRL